jgi:hypothetical protein
MAMSDNEILHRVDETLHRVLVQFVLIKEEHSVMRVVLQALIQSHKDRTSLLSQFDHLAKLREELDLSQPMDDQTLERRKRGIAEWRRRIDEGTF